MPLKAPESPPTSVAGYEIRPQTPAYVAGCGEKTLAEPTGQPRRVKICFVSYLVLKGQLYLTDELPSGPESFTVKAGEIHVLGPDIPQSSWQGCAPGTRLLWAHFSFFDDPRVAHLSSSDLSASVMPLATDQPSPVWRIPRNLQLGPAVNDFARIHAELLAYQRLYGAKDMGCHQLFGGFITRLHARFQQHCLNREQTTSQQLQVSRARNFIQQHYHRDISLAEVAHAISLSPSYLSRSFRQVMNQTLVDYLLHVRLQAAKDMLTGDGMLPIKEIAFHSGFSSPIYFCRVFRRFEGQTASQYAASVRRAPAPASRNRRR